MNNKDFEAPSNSSELTHQLLELITCNNHVAVIIFLQENPQFAIEQVQPIQSNYSRQLSQWCLHTARIMIDTDKYAEACELLEEVINITNLINAQEEADDINSDCLILELGYANLKRGLLHRAYDSFQKLLTPSNMLDRVPDIIVIRVATIVHEFLAALKKNQVPDFSLPVWETFLSMLLLRQLMPMRFANKNVLINQLKTRDSTRVSPIIKYIEAKEIKGIIYPDKLIIHLIDFIISLITPEKTDEKTTCKTIEFYLDAFRMSANTVIPHGKYAGYTFLMLTCLLKSNLKYLKHFVENMQGDIDLIIDNNANKGRTALVLACKGKNLDAVKYLIEKGADQNNGTITPLNYCLINQREQITEYLLTQISVDIHMPYYGSAPIHLAAKHSGLKTVMRLIHRGASPSATRADGKTPLHAALRAAGNNSRDVARYLLGICKVDVPPPFREESPVFTAARLGNDAALNLMAVNDADIDMVTDTGHYRWHTPLTIAIQEGHKAVVLLLLKKIKIDGNRLYRLLQRNQTLTILQLAKSYLSELPDPDRKEIYEAVKTHWIQDNPLQVRQHIVELIKHSKHEQLLEWKQFILFSRSIDSDLGNSFLHIATKAKEVECARVMLEDIGVNACSINKEGNTVLHVACREKCSSMVDLLLRHQSNIHHKNLAGFTPLNVASNKNDEASVRLLYNAGALIDGLVPNFDLAMQTKQYSLAKIIFEKMSADEVNDQLQNLMDLIATTQFYSLSLALANKLILADLPVTAVLSMIVRQSDEVRLSKVLNLYKAHHGEEALRVEINDNLMPEARRLSDSTIIERLIQYGGRKLSPIPEAVRPIEVTTNVSVSKSAVHNRYRFTSSQLKTIEIRTKLEARKNARADSVREKPKATPCLKPKKLTQNSESPLTRLTNRVENVFSNFTHCSINRIRELLQNLVEFLPEIRGFIKSDQLFTFSPTIAFIRHLDYVLESEEAMGNETCLLMRDTAIAVYQDVLTQSDNVFHLDDLEAHRYLLNN